METFIDTDEIFRLNTTVPENQFLRIGALSRERTAHPEITCLYITQQEPLMRDFHLFPNLLHLKIRYIRTTVVQCPETGETEEIVGLRVLDTSDLKHLQSIECYARNTLKELNVSQNLNLQSLTCISEIEQLDFSNNRELLYLDLQSDCLHSLDLSNNSLIALRLCTENTPLDLSNQHQLKLFQLGGEYFRDTVDLSHNTNLEYIILLYGNLNSIDTSRLQKLKVLLIEYELVREAPFILDVRNNPNLTHLKCTSVDLKKLDVSRNPKLEKLNCCCNNLKRLNLIHKSHLKFLDISYLKLTQLLLPEPNNLRTVKCWGLDDSDEDGDSDSYKSYIEDILDSLPPHINVITSV